MDDLPSDHRAAHRSAEPFAAVAGRPVLILPGLGGSEAAHWQSYWEHDIIDAQRVEQEDWDAPVLTLWLAALRNAIRRRPGALLVAHSLGCILAAHLAAIDPDASVGGALLVAPPDLDEVAGGPASLRSFSPTPRVALPFPAIVAGSRDDPFASFAFTAGLASAWGAELVDLGCKAHVNVAAGIGRWTEGRVLLHRLSLKAKPWGG